MSFARDKFLELAQLNSYRGSASCSVSHVNPDLKGSISVTRKVDRTVDMLPIQENPEIYKIGHIQAPTSTGDRADTVHPASIDNDRFLWHNGIIKDHDVKRLQAELNSDETWDTALMLRLLADSEGWDCLSSILGSFACVFYEYGALFVFRNEISPLFVDAELNMSSVKFKGSSSLPPNKVFMIDIATRELLEVGEFSTKENPYYMPKE